MLLATRLPLRRAVALSVGTPAHRPKYSTSLWEGWLNNVWNRVDENRMRQIGSDRLAAEWLSRLGGAVMILEDQWILDYNSLPPGRLKVIGLDAKGSKVTDMGLGHIVPLKSLKVLKLNDCQYVGDEGLDFILQSRSKNQLKRLELANTRVSPTAVLRLASLEALESLNLAGILAGDSQQSVPEPVAILQQKLPQCNIQW